MVVAVAELALAFRPALGEDRAGVVGPFSDDAGKAPRASAIVPIREQHGRPHQRSDDENRDEDAHAATPGSFR